VARGVQPKRRGLSSPHSRNERRYDKPIWEEEGNLVALLFGRTQSGNSLLFEKLLDPNHGSLLFLLRAVFRSLLLVGSYACRWASVRGAFPQPVVVIGVFSALVCAPRNRRILAVGLALGFFRALGELAHGYAYGNDGWEDDADSSSTGRDEDKDEEDDA
jgi:transposase